MKRILIIIAGLFSIAYGQRYQTMPAEGYGPIKRMRVDSVLNIPIGDTTRKRNLSDGKDSGQIRWFNGSLYVYNGAYWSGVSGGGSGITRTELQDTADAIRASIENYGTFLGDRTINGAGYNFTIDSTFTTEIKSRVNDGGTDVAGLYLDAGNDVGTILYYNTDSTVSQSYHDYSSSGFNFNKISGVNQRNSGINIGINPITQKHLASISADSFQVDIPSAVAGYVLTATDIHGTATWQPASSGGSNVGDSLVRAFDSLDSHNTRIGANTVAIATKLNTSDSGSVYQSKFRSDTARTNIYTAIAARAALSGAAFTGSVGIGTSAAASAALEISSTTQGVLLPRMTTTQRDAISSPATNLIVNNTTTTTIDQYSGSSWYSIAGDYDPFLKAAQAMGSPIKAGPLYNLSQMNSSGAMSTGRSYWNAVVVQKPITITGAAFYQLTQGNFTGNNYNGIALYSYSAGTVTLIDSTTRNENIWKGTSGTWQQAAFAGGSRTLQPGLYFLLFLYNSASQTTAPSIGAAATGAANYLAPLTTNSARFYGSVTSGVTSPPTSQAASAWTFISVYLGGFLY